jgi:Secretion system C-terminal sorting domain
LPPPPKPERKIEFIGDSYTSAEGNEWTQTTASPSESYTNIYEGFGPIVARHYNAQYNMSSRAGFGLVVDWQKNYSNNIPDYFDRTLFYTSQPKWDYSQWIPNVVVICLGLNDYNGWGGYQGPVPDDYRQLFKYRYHSFISTLMDVYPGVKILLVAANDLAWLKQQASEVAAEENAAGNTNVYYTYFPYYNGHYVNNGHPDLYAHQMIADRLIQAIDTMDPWQAYQDTIPPSFVDFPDAPFTVTNSPYTLSINTDSYATVRYSTEDKPYDQMENEFTTTGTRIHSVSLPVEQNNQYTYYLRAKDAYGNVMDSSGVIQFNVDTTKALIDWKSLSYDNSGWQQGTAPLGNDGTGGIVTSLAPAITAYFRQEIDIPDISGIFGIRVSLKGHDGMIAYLNGNLVGRINLPTSSQIPYETYATLPKTISDSLFLNFSNPASYLHNGKNTLAIEVHSKYSPDPNIFFDAKIYVKDGPTLSDFGSTWYYFDNGKIPDDQVGNITGVEKVENTIPERITLYQNYPNPFNPSTNISFELNKKTFVEVKIFDVLGEQMEVLVNNELNPGKYNIKFNGKNYSSGIYFYQLHAGDFTEVKKMILMK